MSGALLRIERLIEDDATGRRFLERAWAWCQEAEIPEAGATYARLVEATQTVAQAPDRASSAEYAALVLSESEPSWALGLEIPRTPLVTEARARAHIARGEPDLAARELDRLSEDLGRPLDALPWHSSCASSGCAPSPAPAGWPTPEAVERALSDLESEEKKRLEAGGGVLTEQQFRGLSGVWQMRAYYLGRRCAHRLPARPVRLGHGQVPDDHTSRRLLLRQSRQDAALLRACGDGHVSGSRR